MKKRLFLLSLPLLALTACYGQPLNQKKIFTRQDSLRGSINPNRSWWDVQRYDITVKPDYVNKSISGSVRINFSVTGNSTGTMQLDLQEPMILDSVLAYLPSGNAYHTTPLPFKKEGNTWMVQAGNRFGKSGSVLAYFHGVPLSAKNPPWDGGWIWRKDVNGAPWMSVACQGLGASVWYPCKDHQSDEPDGGASLKIYVPDSLVAVANGKLVDKQNQNGLAAYTWEVKNPINTYNIVPYIGKYVHFMETYKGEKGLLNLSYWVLDYNLEKAKKQFKQAPMTLQALEHWFGPFPWYEDDFKLVESPHLGMEHQSAVAYGNRYQNGYLGQDLSGTGVGKKWDFIIVHEVGHEWFGNNITTKDIADMWVHEGFTSYGEALFHEFHYGKAEASQYVLGTRRNIENDIPVIGPYGVNAEGSGDMYNKGANMLHTIRQVIGNDEKFRQILRGLNKDFYHQTVTTRQVEAYISKKSGIDFSKIFDQYLRTTMIPELELDFGEETGKYIRYRWKNVVPGFKLTVPFGNGTKITPTTKWQQLDKKGKDWSHEKIDVDYYIKVTVL